MAVQPFNKFYSFVEALAEKVHKLDTDALKVMLTNTAPVATNTKYSDISSTELANGAGYTTGGLTPTITSSALDPTTHAYKLILADIVWTASASMGPFRYAVLYNNTATNKELIGWWDNGSAVTLNSGESFTVDYDATQGVIQLQ